MLRDRKCDLGISVGYLHPVLRSFSEVVAFGLVGGIRIALLALGHFDIYTGQGKKGTSSNWVGSNGHIGKEYQAYDFGRIYSERIA